MASPDNNALFEELMPLVEQMTKKYEHLAPFGAAIGKDGKLVLVAGYDGTEEGPADLEELVLAGLREGVSKGDYRATALVIQLRELRREGGKPSQAIKVSLEDGDESIAVYTPFTRNLLKRVTFLEPFAQASEPQVFRKK